MRKAANAVILCRVPASLFFLQERKKEKKKERKKKRKKEKKKEKKKKRKKERKRQKERKSERERERKRIRLSIIFESTDTFKEKKKSNPSVRNFMTSALLQI